ncbi:MAG: hypothetical protein IT531_23070 [Burkholderiales bacterium]|nr:hypothetical protein [Burkholderiales bacterium]
MKPSRQQRKRSYSKSVPHPSRERRRRALASADDAQREQLLRQTQRVAFAHQAVVPLHYQVNAWAARKGYS